jgi:hypothetical protein
LRNHERKELKSIGNGTIASLEASPEQARIRGTITSGLPRPWECYTPKYRYLAEEAGLSTSPGVHTEKPIRSGGELFRFMHLCRPPALEAQRDGREAKIGNHHR